MRIQDYEINNVRALIESFGWIDLGPQKNTSMISFLNEETKERMNVYYTTMTITIQAPRSRFPKTWKNCTIEDVESILQTGDVDSKKLW